MKCKFINNKKDNLIKLFGDKKRSTLYLNICKHHQFSNMTFQYSFISVKI